MTTILITVLPTVARTLPHPMTHEQWRPADGGKSCEDEIDRDGPEYQTQRMSATDCFSQQKAT